MFAFRLNRMKMRHNGKTGIRVRTVYLFLTLLLLALPASASPLFTGNWGGEYDDANGQPIFIFSMDLQQKDNHTLTGNYCIATQIKIDCPDYNDPDYKENENILYGTIKGNTATVFFGPSRKGRKGKAILKLNNDILLWYMVTEPAYTDQQVLNIVDLPRIQQFTKGDFDKDVAPRSREYSLKHFIIVVTNTCGNFLTPCDNMFYTGIRRKDSSMIELTGKTTTDSVTHQVNGAIFDNGDTRYQLWFTQPFRLQVTQNNKVLLNETSKQEK